MVINALHYHITQHATPCPSAEIQVMKRPDGTDWQLGSGGFGTVFKALRNGVQPVAVKVLGSVRPSTAGVWLQLQS